MADFFLWIFSLFSNDHQTYITLGPSVYGTSGFGRISNRILDIEIARPYIWSDIKPYTTENIRLDIRQFNLLYQTTLKVLPNPSKYADCFSN